MYSYEKIKSILEGKATIDCDIFTKHGVIEFADKEFDNYQYLSNDMMMISNNNGDQIMGFCFPTDSLEMIQAATESIIGNDGDSVQVQVPVSTMLQISDFDITIEEGAEGHYGDSVISMKFTYTNRAQLYWAPEG